MPKREFLFLTKLLHILIKNGKKSQALKVFLLLIKNLKNQNLNGLSATSD